MNCMYINRWGQQNARKMRHSRRAKMHKLKNEWAFFFQAICAIISVDSTITELYQNITIHEKKRIALHSVEYLVNI